MKKHLFVLIRAAVLVSIMASANLSYADVTGDFKVLTATYTNPGNEGGGDVTVTGSVNHGAIQSGKQVTVDITYSYMFEYQIRTTTATTTTVCLNSHDNIAYEGPCTNANNKNGFHDGTITHDITVTTTLPVSGMKAVTEPTISASGRLNPKGKITGYDWSNITSITPLDSIVDLSLIPDGGTFVEGSVKITGVSFTTYLVESGNQTGAMVTSAIGTPISDTIVTGVLFPL